MARLGTPITPETLEYFGGQVKYVDREGGKMLGRLSYQDILLEMRKHRLEKVMCADKTVCIRRTAEPAAPVPVSPLEPIYNGRSTAVANAAIGCYQQPLPVAVVASDAWGDRTVAAEGEIANRVWSFHLSRGFDNG